MFLGSSLESWLITLVFAAIAAILAIFARAIVVRERREASKTAQTDGGTDWDTTTEQAEQTASCEQDAWRCHFPSGKFMRSWYLNMDVLEEGVTELGSRYRILRDNDTGILYYADRMGMSVIVKDYARTRYA